MAYASRCEGLSHVDLFDMKQHVLAQVRVQLNQEELLVSLTAGIPSFFRSWVIRTDGSESSKHGMA